MRHKVWHKAAERWLDQDETCLRQDGSVSELGNYELEGDISDQVEVVRSTGLKDNRGKEIYEGDVVRWTASIGEVDLKPITWNEERTGFRFGVYSFDRDEAAKRFQIVGNIYENPELLGEQE